jgi:hypothetical protein
VSSRLEEDGTVVITAPYCWAEVGHRLAVVGSASEYGIAFADWVERLLRPQPQNGRAHHGLDTRAADEALRAQLCSLPGESHASLVEEPAVAA